MKLLPVSGSGLILPPSQTTLTKPHTPAIPKGSSKLLRNSLLGLALLGAAMLTSCGQDDDISQLEINRARTTLVDKHSISEKTLDDYTNINDKANFIFHQLGLIDKDKRINDIAEISFVDGAGERYILDKVGECQYGPEFAGVAIGHDGVKRHAKLRMFQGNELANNNLCISTWHSGNHDSAYLTQEGWEFDESGNPQAVFHEFRTAVNSPERGKYGEYIHNKDNEFVIERTPDGFISRAIGKNPGTPNEQFRDFQVKYKTGDEQEDPFVTVVDPSDIAVIVNYMD